MDKTLTADDVLRLEAKRHCALVEQFLAAGAPPTAQRGAHCKTALRLAYEALGIPRMTFINRVGAPGLKGYYAKRYGLEVDWSLYQPGPYDHRTPRRAAKVGLLGFKPVLPGFEVKQTTETTDGSGNLKRRSVVQMQARDQQFALPDGFEVKRLSTLHTGNGEIINQWTIAEVDRDRSVLRDALTAAIKEGRPCCRISEPTNSADPSRLVVIPVADPHLGMYGWREETGADYDMSIAENLLESCARELIEDSPATDVCLILDLGDYFHADNHKAETPQSGNRLDVDTRQGKVVRIGFELTCKLIELALQKFKRVVYRKLPGNHDPESSIWLAIAVKARFHDNPRVEAADDAGRWYMTTFGKTMIVATHGDKAKPEEIPLFSAATWPEQWGQTQFRFGLSGHIHTKKVIERGGMLVEAFRTLAPRDAWAVSMGFASGRSMEALIFHRERGMRGRKIVDLPMLDKPAEFKPL